MCFLGFFFLHFQSESEALLNESSASNVSSRGPTHSLVIFCFCEQFAFLEWTNNGDVLLDFAYWPASELKAWFSASSLWDNMDGQVKMPVMNCSFQGLMDYKALFTVPPTEKKSLHEFHPSWSIQC